MVYVKEGSGNWTLYNIGRDYLGSVTHIATSAGVLVAEYSYDPWGRQRDPATLDIYEPGDEPDLFLGRGFTGHEHLDWCGLINMNARLYDPLYGRFLSPDPFVQTPDFSQNFNRYSYALNNPLKYTDEDGEFFTWSVSGSGIQLGVNFGFWGFGLTFSWSSWSIGAYVEEGFRFGGTIFGYGISVGATLEQTISYQIKNNIWNASLSAKLSASYGPLSGSLGVSYSANDLGGDTKQYVAVSGSVDYSILPFASFSGSFNKKTDIQSGQSELTFTAGGNLKISGLPYDSFIKMGTEVEWKKNNKGLEFSGGYIGIAAGSNGDESSPYRKKSLPKASDYLPWSDRGFQHMKKTVGGLSEVNLAKIEYFEWKQFRNILLPGRKEEEEPSNIDKK